MNAGRDVERLIADWFIEEAVLRAPDRLLDRTGLVVDRTKQRRFGAAWRTRLMSTPMRLAAAAVLGVLVVGGALIMLGRPSQSVGDGSPSPPRSPIATPSAALSAEPRQSASAEPASVLPAGGPLTPGRYVMQAADTPVDVEFTVGRGWTSGGWYINNDTQSISFWTVSKVYADACDTSSAPETALARTVDDLVAALDAQLNTDMSAPIAVTIDGHPGVKVDLSPTSQPQYCSELTLWPLPDGGPGRAMDPLSGVPGERIQPVWILDVDGERVVFVAWDSLVGSDPTAIADVIDSMTLARR